MEAVRRLISPDTESLEKAWRESHVMEKKYL